MKIQIENKSLLAGLVVGISAMFLMGADWGEKPPVPHYETGRYQAVTIAGANGAQAGTAIMIDTSTGQAWAADINHDFKNGGFWDVKVK